MYHQNSEARRSCVGNCNWGDHGVFWESVSGADSGVDVRVFSG